MKFYLQVQREAEIGLKTTPPEKFGVKYRPFIGYSVMGQNLTIQKLEKAVSNIGENKLAELMVHPGYVSKGSKLHRNLRNRCKINKIFGSFIGLKIKRMNK